MEVNISVRDRRDGSHRTETVVKEDSTSRNLEITVGARRNMDVVLDLPELGPSSFYLTFQDGAWDITEVLGGLEDLGAIREGHDPFDGLVMAINGRPVRRWFSPAEFQTTDRALPLVRPGDILGIGPFELCLEHAEQRHLEARIHAIVIPPGSERYAMCLAGHGMAWLVVSRTDCSKSWRVVTRVDNAYYTQLPSFAFGGHGQRAMCLYHNYHLTWTIDGGSTFRVPTEAQISQLGFEKFSKRQIGRVSIDDTALAVQIVETSSHLFTRVLAYAAKGISAEELQDLCTYIPPDQVALEEHSIPISGTSTICTRRIEGLDKTRDWLMAIERAEARQTAEGPFRIEGDRLFARDNGGGWSEIPLLECAREFRCRTGLRL